MSLDISPVLTHFDYGCPALEEALETILAQPGILGIAQPYVATKDTCLALTRPMLFAERDDAPSADGITMIEAHELPDGPDRDRVAAALLRIGTMSHFEDWLHRLGPGKSSPRDTSLVICFMRHCVIAHQDGIDDVVEDLREDLADSSASPSLRARVCTVATPLATSNHQRLAQPVRVREDIATWRRIHGNTIAHLEQEVPNFRLSEVTLRQLDHHFRQG